MLQNFAIPAGGRIVNAQADYFRYESCNSSGLDETIRVRADGSDMGMYLPGDQIELPIHAISWEITPVTPAATAVVRLGVGRVRSSRVSGNTTVIDAISANCQVSPNAADTTVGFVAIAIVTPAQNASGVILRGSMVEVQRGAGGLANCRIIAAPVAPTSLLPSGGPAAILNSQFSSQDGVTSTNYMLDQSKRIPAGWGIYFCKNVSAVAAVVCAGSIVYEVL